MTNSEDVLPLALWRQQWTSNFCRHEPLYIFKFTKSQAVFKLILSHFIFKANPGVNFMSFKVLKKSKFIVIWEASNIIEIFLKAQGNYLNQVNGDSYARLVTYLFQMFKKKQLPKVLKCSIHWLTLGLVSEDFLYCMSHPQLVLSRLNPKITLELQSIQMCRKWALAPWDSF